MHPGGGAELCGQTGRSPADGGAGDAAQPPLSAPLLIRFGRGLPLDWAVCRGDRHAEGSHQPEPQFSVPTYPGSQLPVAVGLATEPDAQTLEQAVAAAQRALALNDSYHWGHIVLGSVYLWQKQYEQALAEMERAIALVPTEADSYAGLAVVLSRVGRPEEALGGRSTGAAPEALYCGLAT